MPWRIARKPRHGRELLCEYVFRPVAQVGAAGLARLRVPPPAVVLANFATGLAAAWLLAERHFVWAAVLLQVKTVLDNADGQLARMTGGESVLGRYLDSECDLLVNAALFAAIGYATGRWFLALVAFLVSTIVLSVNYNLRRLYLRERGSEEELLPVTGLAARAARRFYELVYAPQDRAVDWFVRRFRVTYDRRALTVLHNLGLATQHTVIAACLVLAARL